MKCKTCGHEIIKDKENGSYYHKNYVKGEICSQCDKCERIRKHCFNPKPNQGGEKKK